MAIRLSVNVDHVATVREARKTYQPDPVAAAMIAEIAGADGVTIHLRSDRRHINERDLQLIMQTVNVPVTLEMAATNEMVNIAMANRPNVVTLVPEKPEEITTEGGLNVAANFEPLKLATAKLQESKVKVCLFVNPDMEQIGEAKRLGADLVELNTGIWADAPQDKKSWELERIKKAIDYAVQVGLKATAGHGITYQSVSEIVKVPHIHELSIGHSIVSKAIFTGLESAIKEMKSIILRDAV